jgi:hypothetical protein
MSAQDRIVQLIIASNPQAAVLQASYLDFSAPIALTPPTPKNTELTIAAKEASGFVGAVTLRYNRNNLAALLPFADFAIEGDVTLEAILDKLNTAAGTHLSAEDFQSMSIPTFIYGVVGTVTLIATDTSLEWVGQLEVRILRLRNETSKLDQLVAVVVGIQQEVDILEDMLGVGGDSVSVLLQAVKLNNTSDDFFFGQAVYATGTNGIALAKANAEATTRCIGLVASIIIESGGGEGKIQTTGVLTGSVAQWEFVTGMVGGLVPNKPYFVDPTVKGQITPFPLNFNDGQFLTCVGIAVSPTQMAINTERPIAL